MVACLVLRFGSVSSQIRSLEYVLNNTFRKRSSQQNHSMSQLNVYYIMGVQFRRHFVEEKVNC